MPRTVRPKPAPDAATVGLNPMVRGLVQRAQVAGFAVYRDQPGGAVHLVRRPPHEWVGLVGISRTSDGSYWALFAGWPLRRATLAELRTLCDELAASTVPPDRGSTE